MGLTKLICCIRIVIAICVVLLYILCLNDCLHYDSNNGVLHRKTLNCNLNVACGWGTCMCDSARAYLLKRALTAAIWNRRRFSDIFLRVHDSAFSASISLSPPCSCVYNHLSVHCYGPYRFDLFNLWHYRSSDTKNDWGKSKNKNSRQQAVMKE